jgi:hypothetical protein
VDRLALGGFELRNVTFLVVAKDAMPFVELSSDRQGILGFPVPLAFGAVRWTRDRNFKIRFPRATNAGKPNLCLRGNSYPIVAGVLGTAPIQISSTRGRAGARSRRALRGSSAQWRRTARGRTRDASGISPTAWTARSSRCPVCRFTPVGSTSCCGPPRWSRTAAVDRSSYHVWLCMDILGQARLVPWISVMTFAAE